MNLIAELQAAWARFNGGPLRKYAADSRERKFAAACFVAGYASGVAAVRKGLADAIDAQGPELLDTILDEVAAGQ